MRVKGELSFKSAIIINDVFLRDINQLIYEYFEEPRYSAQLVNGDEVEFESVLELISYDNFSDHAIKTMRIVFGIGNYIRIEPAISYINGYRSTLEMFFEVENNDKSEEIKRKVNLICEKHKQSIMYTLASKFTLMHICLVIILIGFVSNLRVLITHKEAMVEFSNSTILSIWSVTIVVLFLMNVLVSLLIKKIFPAIVFYLGENIKKVEKNSRLKSNIFWGVIVAGIVSMIVSFIF